MKTKTTVTLYYSTYLRGLEGIPGPPQMRPDQQSQGGALVDEPVAKHVVAYKVTRVIRSDHVETMSDRNALACHVHAKKKKVR